MTRKPVLVGAALVLFLAGCGGSSSGDGAANASGSGSGATTVAPVPNASSPTADPNSCAVPQKVTDAATDSHITKVSVDGGCHQVSIETSLTSGAGGVARKICDDMAKVAYDDNLSSITVSGSDKHELAAGQQGMDSCIGQPG